MAMTTSHFQKCKQTNRCHSLLGHVTSVNNAYNEGEIMCIDLTQECLSTQNEPSDHRLLESIRPFLESVTPEGKLNSYSNNKSMTNEKFTNMIAAR